MSDHLVVHNRLLKVLNAYRVGFFSAGSAAVLAGCGILYLLSFTLQPRIPVVVEAHPAVSAPRPDPARYTSYILLRSRVLGTKTYTALAATISKSISANCDKYALPPAIVLGLMETESQFNPQALSNRSAKGLMQINLVVNGPELKEILPETEVFDPAKNTEAGCYLLRKFLAEDNRLDRALDHYLGAGVKEYRDKVLAATGRALLEEWTK